MHDFGLALALIPLFVGIVLTQVLRLNLKSFFGVYALLAAGNIAFTYLYLNQGYLAPLITAGVGALAMVLLAGFFGTRIKSSDYALAGVGIGLFPWTIGLLPSISYAIVFALFALIIAMRPKFKNPLRRRYKR